MAMLNSKNVGDTIRIREGDKYVNYIIVQKGKPSDMYDDSCDGVWVMREYAISEQKWNNNVSNDYANSTIHKWLNKDYLDILDPGISELIKPVKIPYKEETGSEGLSCKAFLLSALEVGFLKSEDSDITEEGTKLDYFLEGRNNSAATNLRLCKNSTNAFNSYWWLRSPAFNDERYVSRVTSDGSQYAGIATGENSVRPAFVLSYSLPLADDGLTLKQSLVVTQELPLESGERIKVCTVSFDGEMPSDAIVRCEVTNNAKDSDPIWENCTYNVKKKLLYIFRNATAANGFAFNFKLALRSGESGEGGYISKISGGFE